VAYLRQFKILLGTKPEVVSEALGHASVAFTMDTYSHIISGMQEEAIALLDGALPEGVSKRNNANLMPRMDITVLST
jgi:alcohol dehydrogenase class IV